MGKWRNATLYFLILCLLLTMTACQQKKGESVKKQPKDPFKVLETPLEELEAGLLAVMGKTDLVPYYEKQIAAKKKKEEEQKQTTPPTSGTGQAPATPPAKEEFKPEPVTIKDILLAEIIKNEQTKQEGGVAKEEKKPIPDAMVSIWDDINTKISTLHEMWNDLEPKLSEANVSKTALTDFDNALNQLTIAGTNNQHMETLIQANAATGQFGEFMKASKEKAQPPLFFIKYYTREIILTAANNNYAKANEHFQALRSQVDTLGIELAEKNVKDQIAMLKAAVDDLESVLRVQDLDLLKVKASIIVKDITSLKEKLAET